MKTLGLMVGNALGKLFGIVRELLLAYFLGTSGAADAYRVSLAAVLVPTHFFMGDVLEGAFVPVYIRLRNAGHGRSSRLLQAVTLYLLATSFVVILVVLLAPRALIAVLAPGLASTSVILATRMLRWMCLGVPLYCLAHLGALRALSNNQVRPLALRQPMLNLGFILAIPIAAYLGAPQWIGAGFVVGVTAYFGIVLWEMKRIDESHGALSDTLADEPSGISQLFNAAAPLFWVMVLGQGLTMIDRAAASFVGSGGVASLEYARTFVETPQVIVGAAVATRSLSQFSLVGKNALVEKAEQLVFPMISGCLIGMIALAVVAPEVVTIVLRRGRFDQQAVQAVAVVIRGLATGAAFYTAAYVMHRILAAQLRAREGVAPLGGAAIAAVLANLLLVPRFGLWGVAVSTSIGQGVLCLMVAGRLGLRRSLVRRVPGWAMAALLAAGSRAILPIDRAPVLARAAILGGLAVAAALLGLSLTAVTRADARLVLARLAEWRVGLLNRPRTA